jgi:hypothetical protein
MITDILVTVGELGQGQTPSPEDAQYCLTRTNAVLDSLSQEMGYIYTRTVIPYTLTANTGTYQIGTSAGAPFNTARPTKIDFARILMQVGGVYIGVKDLDIIDVVRYDEYSDKTTAGRVPETLYYDNAFPLGNLNLYPVPTCLVPTQLELTAWLALPQFTSLTDVFVFPPGYYEMLVLIIGVAVSPSYNKPVDQVTAGRAAQYSQRVKDINRMILQPGAPPIPVAPGAQGNPQEAAQVQAALKSLQ